jgi:4'-phosphopantetheinyl transferase
MSAPAGTASPIETRWYTPGLSLAEPLARGPVVILHVPDVGGDRDAAVVAPWLSDDELARRERILHPRALAEFLAGRRLVRELLGRLLGVAPAELRLVANRYGALALDPDTHGRRWCFNLSHTDGLLALAVAESSIGVDVEDVTRPGRTVELADRFFAPSEIAALHALPEAGRRARFFDLWTLKEAYIKARGMGLAIPLADFAFTLGDGPIRIRVAPSVADGPDSRWHFDLRSIGDGHRLAVAILE